MIISISNQKGGVGKTTTALNVAACLAQRGKQVLLIDLDPQGNLSRAWGLEETAANVYSVVLGDVSITEAIIPLSSQLLPPPKGVLSIIPGSSSFSRYEKVRAGEINAQFDLKNALKPIEKDYDYIILDCPPALGLITINALTCSEYVLVPLEAQLFAMEGLEGICNTIKQIQEFSNTRLALGGIFFVRHDKRKVLNRAVREFIEQHYAGFLLETAIRENVALREAPHESTDIFSYAPSSNGAEDYRKLTQEIISRLCKSVNK